MATSGSDRADVVAVVKRLADHPIDHNYNLVDDGKPKRWGFFGPDQLNLNPWRETPGTLAEGLPDWSGRLHDQRRL